MQRLSSLRTHPLFRAGVALASLGLCITLVLRLALRERHPPERCPTGMTALGARCCGAGQALTDRACTGRALSCSIGQELDGAGQCVARLGVVSFAGGELFIGGADWDGAQGGVRFPRTRVAPFRLDVAEVTRQRFGASGEPGLPMTDVSPEVAQEFCERKLGRLPTSAEWVFAAAGPPARRYAWGNTGLVCRRAAFGLETGPCAEGGGLELSGSRPDGTSPEGVMDLSGNVAEWTLEAAGGFVARGGSYRSTSAAELKSWAALTTPEKALYIGFRCAYPP